MSRCWVLGAAGEVCRNDAVIQGTKFPIEVKASADAAQRSAGAAADGAGHSCRGALFLCNDRFQGQRVLDSALRTCDQSARRTTGGIKPAASARLQHTACGVPQQAAHSRLREESSELRNLCEALGAARTQRAMQRWRLAAADAALTRARAAPMRRLLRWVQMQTCEPG